MEILWSRPGVHRVWYFGCDNAPQRAARMIPDRDIWRAANLLIREHGAEAEVVSIRGADEMLEHGDPDGQLV